MLMLRFAPRGTDESSDDDESDGEAEIANENLRRNDYSATDYSEVLPLSVRERNKTIRTRKSLASVD